MLLLCPKCSQPVSSGEINIAADLAKCLNCDEVFKASELVEAPEEAELTNPPAGTAIVYDAGDGELGAFRIPAKGFGVITIFPLVFVTFWLSVVAVWTWIAAKGSVFFALFSLPFWLVGLGILRGIISAVSERQTIEIGREELVMRKQSPLSRKITRIGMMEIQTVGVESFRPTNPFEAIQHAPRLNARSGNYTGIPVPTISHGGVKTRFGENLNEAEMDWLVKVLKATVYKFAGKRV